MRMLTLLRAPDKRPHVERTVLLHFATVPLLILRLLDHKRSNGSCRCIVLKRKRILFDACVVEKDRSFQPGPASSATLYTACLVFGCHGALGVLAGPCDGVVTQRFFMASGMGWLRSPCNGKSVLLIHTDGPLSWAEPSFTWRQQQTATQQTPDSSVSQHVYFMLMSSVMPLKFDRTYSSRWNCHCSSVDPAHLFSPKAWHCFPSHTQTHTHLCMHNYNNKHMLPSPPPPRQNLKLSGQKANHSPHSTIWLVNNSKL